MKGGDDDECLIVQESNRDNRSDKNDYDVILK